MVIQQENFGFTIIEILVSITVIFILFSLTSAGYSRFARRQTLISAGQTVKSTLRDAQNRAYSGEMDCSVCDCSPSDSRSIKGWHVDLNSNKIYGECRTAGGDVTFRDSSFVLPDKIAVTAYITPSSSSVMFRYYPPGSDHEAQICVASSDISSLYYKITVEKSGRIADADSLVSSCP